MTKQAHTFQFDDELIAELARNKEDDACGVLRECREERCPCYLLGRRGMSIEVFQDDHGRWIVRGTNPEVAHDTLEQAVRTAQAEQEAALLLKGLSSIDDLGQDGTATR